MRCRRESSRARLGPAGVIAGLVLVMSAFVQGSGSSQARAEQQTSPPMSSDAAMSRFLVAVTGTPVALELRGRHRVGPDAERARNRALAELAPVERAVVALGGTVRGRYVDAVRTLAVSLPVAAVPNLARVPGVVSIEPVVIHHRPAGPSTAGSAGQARSSSRGTVAGDQADRVLGTSPVEWARRGWTGRGVRIAILDTGVDYTHADFGGPGTVSAFTGNDGTTIEPGTFPTAKVVAGFDFVGDAYDADSAEPAARLPVPDPDPIDCQGHGTHVAGSAAGFGVQADGSTFAGPYEAKALAGLSIPPGTAPQALLMAYRVFGCEGDNDSEVVVAAIDRAVRDGADVINMSMGREFGTAQNIEAVAADNAARAGVVVVASAGNAGPVPYLVGTPSTGTRVLSVAALDAVLSDPGGAMERATPEAEPILMRLANEATLPVSGPIRVLRDAQEGISLGCQASDYVGADGAIVVVKRGVCPRVDRPAFAQAAGALAVIMVNDSPVERPPAEGAIPGVTIPFLGARQSDGPALTELDGQARTIRPAQVANDTARQPTAFTSAGPRTGDSGVKPDLAAPGARIVSAASGSGVAGATLSGTSMAAPFVAGVAAVVRQAHPTWTAEQVSAALTGTASVSGDVLSAPDRRRAGTGVVNPLGATQAPVLLLGPSGGYGVSFGVHERADAISGAGPSRLERIVRVLNPTARRLSVRLDVRANGPIRAAFGISASTVDLDPGEEVPVRVWLELPQGDQVASVEAAGAAAGDVGPLAAATLVATVEGGAPAAPVRMLMQGLVLHRSDISAEVSTDGSFTLANEGLASGSAEPFSWILADDRDKTASADLRAIGIRSDPAGDRSDVPGDRIITFAVNQYDRFSNPARNRYTINVDVDADGGWDHSLLGVDQAFFMTGNDVTALFDGVFTAQAVDLVGPVPGATERAPSVQGQANAPMNGSTILLSAPASALGLSAEHPLARLSVTSVSFVDPVPMPDTTSEVTVNAWDPGIFGGTVKVAAGSRASTSFSTGPTGTVPGTLGTMIVMLDNRSGPAQARLIPGGTSGATS